jgi:hypothetical protein
VGATQGRHFDGRALPPTVKLGFAAAPDIPTPGQRSTVTVTLENGGSAMIQVRQVVVSTESGGDRRTETESSQALVAPGQKMPVLLRTVSWPASPPWSMEVVVHTRSGDTYTSTVTWR